jgi:4-hydroxy-tetrahydrodipicolinate reductase
MGRLVVPALRRAGFTDVAGCDPGTSAPLVVEDGPVDLVHDLLEGLAPGGVIVDFSRPSASASLERAAVTLGARLVVGTTGQSAGELACLHRAAERVPVVLGRNFSLGINRIAQVLPELRDLTRRGFDVECIELHHRQKRDAPSGTALLWLEALLGDVRPSLVHGRSGPDCLRQDGEVGVHSRRLGQIPGEHTLVLASDHEVVEIRHRALDRAAFVSGVPPAVRFVQSQPPGLYDVQDVMRNEMVP